MTPLEIGALVGIVTLIVLAAGVPIAFGLGFVAVVFLTVFQGAASLDFVG